MTDRKDDMTDETRDEIVRLARKGWTVGQVLDSLHKSCPSGQQRWLTEEQVQAVIDEADREVERMLTPTVPQDNDPIGRIAKWLDEAREAGYTSREQAEMLVKAIAEAADDDAGLTREESEFCWSDCLADQLDAMAGDDGVPGSSAHG